MLGSVSQVWMRVWSSGSRVRPRSMRESRGMGMSKEAAGEGCRVFDLLRGDEPYKYRFGATDRRLERLMIARG